MTPSDRIRASALLLALAVGPLVPAGGCGSGKPAGKVIGQVDDPSVDPKQVSIDRMAAEKAKAGETKP